MRTNSKRTGTQLATLLLAGLAACDGKPDQSGEPEQNLLRNPGFEAGAQGDGCPVEWVCVAYRPSDAGRFSTSSTIAFRDDHSAEWSGGEGAPGTVIKQSHPSAEGREYQVAAWYRSEGLATSPFIQVLFHDAGGELLFHESFHGRSGTRDWTRITGATLAAPTGAAQVQINLSTTDTAGRIWWDEAAMFEVSDPSLSPPEEPDSSTPPPADFEIIAANGQTIFIQDGEIFENKLIDFTTGGNLSINARNATRWTIRNIGFKGRKQTPGTLFGVSDARGGTSIMENIYMADGSSRAGGQATCSTTSGCTHGPVGIFVGPEHSGHIDFRNINVQGWPNNGIYGSAPGSNANGRRGTIHVDSSLGANNYVSSFRIAGGSGNLITNSVAYNDGSGGYNGRPIWVWKPGPITIRDVHLDRGSYPHALVAGANGDPTRVRLEDSQVRGPILEASGSVVTRVNVGSQPELAPPAGVPLSAEEAASGTAGQ